MIPIPSGSRVWIATGHTDMRRGMQGLALQVQEGLKRDPHLCVGRGYVAARPSRPWFNGVREPWPSHNIQARSRFGLRMSPGTPVGRERDVGAFSSIRGC